MPYLLLIIGILVFAYAVYKFLLKANAKQIASFIGMLAVLIFSCSMIYLAITGRLHAAIAGIGALYPWAVAFHKWRKNKKTNNNTPTDTMTRKEALDILGLEEDASKKDIDRAYKELMKKHHPDTEGSEYFAKKLNEARKILEKK